MTEMARETTWRAGIRRKASFVCAEAGKCKFNKVYCQDVSDAFWQMLLDDLSSAGQFGASSSMSNSTISKLNDFFYVFQPKVHVLPYHLLL